MNPKLTGRPFRVASSCRLELRRYETGGKIKFLFLQAVNGGQFFRHQDRRIHGSGAVTQPLILW